MEPKKSAFSYFVIILYLIGTLYILICGVNNLGEGQEYPYVLQGAFLVAFILLWLFINALAAFSARLELEDIISKRKKLFCVAEAMVVLVILAVAVYVRLICIQKLPMEPESDYKTYYEIADLLKRGILTEEGAGYCDYIAMFPHVFGYPYVLSVIFRIFGTSVRVAQIFNVVLAAGAIFISYRIARLIGGAAAGVYTLFLTAFWPSQILYINQVASEYLFSFMLLLCLYIFMITIKKYDAKVRHPVVGVLLYILLGILLALTACVRPMALILLITIIMCIFFRKMWLPVKKVIDQPVSLVILSKGWMRCAIVVLTYFMISSFCSMGIEYAIDRPLASGSASFGYNLLVGLNQESMGGWNQEDADYLYNALDEYRNATEAHLVCRDLAIQRLKGAPEGIFNLFLYKFRTLWSNDDYGSTWSILFMDQQGTLTREREQFLYKIRDFSNLYYLMVVAFAAVGGVFLWKKGNIFLYPFCLIFVGTVGMHLLVENQNRYHYHALFMFALIAGCTVKDIYAMNRSKVLALREEKERIQQQAERDRERMQKILEDEEMLVKLREEAMKSQFDMRSALEKGYIKMSVSEAYGKDYLDGSAEDGKESEI